jgi:hypothetical protein
MADFTGYRRDDSEGDARREVVQPTKQEFRGDPRIILMLWRTALSGLLFFAGLVAGVVRLLS